MLYFFLISGDEEERRSFRSKGIPVIFQDELDEKPEIGNKSPVILKDEKPPLLPPSYTSTNPDGKFKEKMNSTFSSLTFRSLSFEI
jgi:hypothetical protein